MRCFEAPACGAVLITDDVVDLPNCYEDGVDVLTYESPESLTLIYKKLLEDENKLKRIASAGHAKAANSHSYKCRVQTVLNDMSIV